MREDLFESKIQGSFVLEIYVFFFSFSRFSGVDKVILDIILFLYGSLLNINIGNHVLLIFFKLFI